MLVFHEHRNDTENQELLEKYKQRESHNETSKLAAIVLKRPEAIIPHEPE